ncbi:hypothetical protein AgCh_004723 [Apium graveolens]
MKPIRTRVVKKRVKQRDPLIPRVFIPIPEESFELPDQKPPELDGSADPTNARAWLKEMEKAFALFKVEEDQKMDFASYFLKGETNYWWKSKKALEGEGVVNWDRFTELFWEKYFPCYIKNQMEIKFLELKQGNLSVTDYEAKFTELARFVP